MDGKDGNDRIRRAYERAASGYDRGIKIADRLLERGRRKVGEATPGRVLEVGIGTGLSLPFYAPSAEITGIDLSSAMLARAAERAGRLDRGVVLHEMDAEQLDFADASFDSVAFSLVLCTVPDVPQALAEALRVVRPGGALAFLEHVRSDRPAIAALQGAINVVSSRLANDHFNRDTEGAVRAAGVEVTAVDRWGLGALTVIVGRRPLGV
ncbi:MAG: class I SAM-dependent methyltransferase [Candidatus Dormibacteraceae bacterium]